MRRYIPLLIALCALGGWLALGSSAASANRFGPPWQSRVIVDRAQIYAQPDLSSPVVGPLSRGATVVVTGEQTDSAGHEWTATTLGFVPSDNVTEYIDSWIADVSVPSAAVYAKPNARDAIRMNVKPGDLLRVTGVSPGLNSDPNIWWSTTEGYVSLDAL